MTRRNLRAASWLLVPLAGALATGCGAKPESSDFFSGTGEFVLTVLDGDGKPTVHYLATLPRLALRRGKLGGTDVVLDRSCALRSVGGGITGTYSCDVKSPAGAMKLVLQSGTWAVTEPPTAYSSDGCQLHRYLLVVDATGTIRYRSSATATLHYEGHRELQSCPQSGGVLYGGTPWTWSEDPYTGDSGWTDGYDWDDDGDWDSGGGGWSGDYGDDGDYGDWGGGDWGGDDGGGDGDGGGGGDDGDWAKGNKSKSRQARAAPHAKSSSAKTALKKP